MKKSEFQISKLLLSPKRLPAAQGFGRRGCVEAGALNFELIE
jgi:hypothetical protein